MNKAFVKETDDERASNPLPDRPIPVGPNLVTAEGLVHLDRMVAEVEQEHGDALAVGGVNEIARTERDRRYWLARRAPAQLAGAAQPGEIVEFGSTVTIRRNGGHEQTYRIVGVDEADPAKGTLSHNSPLARAMLGKSKGDEVAMNGTTVEIIVIE